MQKGAAGDLTPRPKPARWSFLTDPSRRMREDAIGARAVHSEFAPFDGMHKCTVPAAAPHSELTFAQRNIPARWMSETAVGTQTIDPVSAHDVRNCASMWVFELATRPRAVATKLTHTFQLAPKMNKVTVHSLALCAEAAEYAGRVLGGHHPCFSQRRRGEKEG